MTTPIQAYVKPSTPRVTFNLVILDIHSAYKHMFDTYFPESEYYKDRGLVELTEVYDAAIYKIFHEMLLSDYINNYKVEDTGDGWPSFIYSKISNYDANIAYKDNEVILTNCIKRSYHSLGISISPYSTIKLMATGSTLLIGIQHSL